MSIPIKHFYCQNCDQVMVMASFKTGEPWRFCRDCINEWIQKQMLQDPSIKRLPDGEKHKAR